MQHVTAALYMLNMVNVNTQINILVHRNVFLPPGPGVLVYGAMLRTGADAAENFNLITELV